MSSHNQSYSTNSLPSFINTSIPSPAHQHQSLHFHFNKNIYFTQKHIPSMISSFPKQNMIGFQMHLSPFFRFRKMKLFSDPLFSFPIHFSAAIHREAYMTFTWLHVDRWGRQILSFFWSSSFRVQIVQKCFSLVIPLVINGESSPYPNPTIISIFLEVTKLMHKTLWKCLANHLPTLEN